MYQNILIIIAKILHIHIFNNRTVNEYILFHFDNDYE